MKNGRRVWGASFPPRGFSSRRGFRDLQGWVWESVERFGQLGSGDLSSSLINFNFILKNFLKARNFLEGENIFVETRPLKNPR
jgi:hypothetical protein